MPTSAVLARCRSSTHFSTMTARMTHVVYGIRRKMGGALSWSYGPNSQHQRFFFLFGKGFPENLFNLLSSSFLHLFLLMVESVIFLSIFRFFPRIHISSFHFVVYFSSFFYFHCAWVFLHPPFWGCVCPLFILIKLLYFGILHCCIFHELFFLYIFFIFS